jgi:HSF-type DNA-binding
MKAKTVMMSRNNDQQQQHGHSNKINYYDPTGNSDFSYNEHGELMSWNDRDEYHPHALQTTQLSGGISSSGNNNIDIADDDDQISQMSSVSQRGWMDYVVQQSYDKAIQMANPGGLQQHNQNRTNTMGTNTGMMPMPMTMMMGANMSQMGSRSGTGSTSKTSWGENSVVSHTDDDGGNELSSRQKDIMMRTQQQLLLHQARERGMSPFGGFHRGSRKTGQFQAHVRDSEAKITDQRQTNTGIQDKASQGDMPTSESMLDVSALSPAALEEFSEDEIDGSLDDMLNTMSTRSLPTVLHHPGGTASSQQQMMQHYLQGTTKPTFRRYSGDISNSARSNMRPRGGVSGNSDISLRKRMTNMMMMPPTSYEDSWNGTVDNTAASVTSTGFAAAQPSTEGFPNNSVAMGSQSVPYAPAGDNQIRWLKQYMKKLENDYKREQQKLHQLIMSTNVDLGEELLMGDDDDVANFDDMYTNSSNADNPNDDGSEFHSSTTSRTQASSSSSTRNMGKGWQHFQRSNKASSAYNSAFHSRMMPMTPSPQQQFQMGLAGRTHSRSKLMGVGGVVPGHSIDLNSAPNTSPFQKQLPPLGRRSSLVSVTSAGKGLPPGFAMSGLKRPALSSIEEQQQAALSSMLSSSSFAYNPAAAAFAVESQRVLQQQAQEPKPKKPRQKKCKSFPVKFMEAISAIGDSREDIVGWLPDGKSLVIVDPAEFLQVVVQPPYFASTTAHTATAGNAGKDSLKYESFVRKLNRWGFTRLASGTGLDCFYHPYFHRDQPEMAAKIEQVHHILAAETEAVKHSGTGVSMAVASVTTSEGNAYDLDTSMASVRSCSSVQSGSGVVQDSSSTNVSGFYGSRFNDLLASKDPPSLSGLNHFVERQKQRLVSTDLQSSSQDTALTKTEEHDVATISETSFPSHSV